jgi:hypothetical protein
VKTFACYRYQPEKVFAEIAFRPLSDDRDFAEIAREASSREPDGANLCFSEDAKRRLKAAFSLLVKKYDLSEAWSEETEEVTRRLAENGLDRGVASEILDKEVRLLFLLYEEGTADLEFFEPGATDPDQRAEKANRSLSEFVSGANLPCQLERQLVDGAKRRMKELSEKKRKGFEAHTHLRYFCSEAIDIIREVDPTIRPRGKRVDRYMRQLFKHLPDFVLLPGQRPILAQSTGDAELDVKLIERALSAFAKQAKRASISQERLKGGGRPMDRAVARKLGRGHKHSQTKSKVRRNKG